MRRNSGLLLDIPPKILYGDFIRRCESLGDLDIRGITELVVRSIQYLKFPDRERLKYKPPNFLQAQWYESLNNGAPDYSVYSDQYYLAELWACWIVYSRYYLNVIQNKKLGIMQDLTNIQAVTDLGCGLGYTSAALTQIFRKSKVTATNLPGNLQYDFALGLANDYLFQMKPRIEDIGAPQDLVFASEYFEHFEDPITHLNDVLTVLNPRFLLLANTFGGDSIGHFNFYPDNGSQVEGSVFYKNFNSVLIEYGYEKIKVKYWHQRPNFWRKIDV